MQLNESQLVLTTILESWLLAESRRRGAPMELAELSEQSNNMAALVTPELSAQEIEQVVNELTVRAAVTQTSDFGVHDSSFAPWLATRKPETTTNHWDCYFRLLQDKGWAPKVVQALDRQTDDVVDLLGDPLKTGSWHRRGLLMGDVQSGKTATYLGVLNKAIDYGYKLIVIIGGHTNDLRSQTQTRVDSDLTGKNSTYLEDHMNPTGEQLRIGIAKLDKNIADHFNVMTTVKSDFSASAKRISGVSLLSGTPTVFVVKKNVRSLEHVQRYIAAQGGVNGFDLPLVVVDDEADWGSPNTNDPDTNPTRVNNAIRELLNTSSRSTYLAVTATPFANALIDHSVDDDLFPIDYIRALGVPSNYMGTRSYFGEGSNLVRCDVDDCLSLLPIKHKKHAPFRTAPPSMLHAIRQFIIGNAIRRVRNPSPVATCMMLNVSRFNDVQGQVHARVVEYLDELGSAAKTDLRRTRGGRKSWVVEELQATLATDFPGTATWDEISGHVVDTIEECDPVLVNNQTAGERNKRRRLMGPQERRAHDLLPKVFIGGDVLSRGLTLEGLQVSYFVREPRSSDTLLQMARWFGYRPGYDDLVRVWMPQKTQRIFTAVASIVREFKDTLQEMEAASLTPRQFGLKIRLIPEIAIVAANKSRAAAVSDVRMSLHGRIAQTVDLFAGETTRAANAAAVMRLMEDCASAGIRYEAPNQPVAFKNVSGDVISRFLGGFTGHSSDFLFGNPENAKAPNILRFMPEVKNRDSWRVVIVSGSGSDVDLPGLGLRFKASIRDQSIYSPSDERIHFANQQVGSPGDLASVFAESNPNPQYHDLRREADVRRALTEPVILLYATTRDSHEESTYFDSERPLWAFRLFFPTLDTKEELDWIERGGGVKFLINSVAQEQYSGSESDDEYEEELDG